MERKFQIQNNFTIIPYPDLVVIKFGVEYTTVDYMFFSSVLYDTEERKILYEPNQLILDFSENKTFDQTSAELIGLIEEYKSIKGKNVVVCGLDRHLEKIYFEWQGKNYLENAMLFDTLEEGLIYCGVK